MQYKFIANTTKRMNAVQNAMEWPIICVYRSKHALNVIYSVLKMHRVFIHALCAGCRGKKKIRSLFENDQISFTSKPYYLIYPCTYVNVFCYCPIVCFHFLVSETRRVVKFERNEQRFIRLKHLVERLDKFEIWWLFLLFLLFTITSTSESTRHIMKF